MDPVKLELEFPRELLGALNVSPQHLAAKAKVWMVLELFREGEISSGRAAELLGMSKSGFIDLLHSRRIPYLDDDLEQLKEDLSNAISCAASRHS